MAAEAVQFLPREFGYVAIVLVLYCFLNMWMSDDRPSRQSPQKYNGGMVDFEINQINGTDWWYFIVLIRYKIVYPTMYASEAENKDAKLFNCVQRIINHKLSPWNFKYYSFGILAAEPP